MLSLNTWGDAREVEGGIALTYQSRSGAGKAVQIVMSPEDWTDYTGTTYGTDDPAKTDIKTVVLATPADARFLVYRMYDWHPSDTPTLPPFPEPTPHWHDRSAASASVRSTGRSAGRAKDS